MTTLFTRLNAVASPAIGLGCMNLSHGYGSPLPEREALRALDAAFDMGYRHVDTATLYGATANERLVGKALAGKRREILLASKCGMAMDPALGRKVIDERPETLRRQCEASLARLGSDHLDLYYLHRWDKSLPIEESVGALTRLDAMMTPDQVAGARYGEAQQAEVDTEEFGYGGVPAASERRLS